MGACRACKSSGLEAGCTIEMPRHQNNTSKTMDNESPLTSGQSSGMDGPTAQSAQSYTMSLRTAGGTRPQRISGKRIDNPDTSKTGQSQKGVIRERNETQRTVSGRRQVAERHNDTEITAFATLLANNSLGVQDIGSEDESDQNGYENDDENDDNDEYNVGEDPDEYGSVDKGPDADKSEFESDDGMDAFRQQVVVGGQAGGKPKPAVAQKRVVSGESEKQSKGARREEDSEDEIDPETCRKSILFRCGNDTDFLGSVQDSLCCKMF